MLTVFQSSLTGRVSAKLVINSSLMIQHTLNMCCVALWGMWCLSD